jgi:putative transposase
MSKRRTADQIVRLLREADRDLAKGLTITDVCRKLGIAGPTYYRWRQEHDPAKVDDARRVRELESEVERLKRLVAELMLDKQMLKDVAKKTTVRQRARRSGFRSINSTMLARQMDLSTAWRLARCLTVGPKIRILLSGNSTSSTAIVLFAGA